MLRFPFLIIFLSFLNACSQTQIEEYQKQSESVALQVYNSYASEAVDICIESALNKSFAEARLVAAGYEKKTLRYAKKIDGLGNGSSFGQEIGVSYSKNGNSCGFAVIPVLIKIDQLLKFAEIDMKKNGFSRVATTERKYAAGILFQKTSTKLFVQGYTRYSPSGLTSMSFRVVE